ncbi:hypothetical protein GE061_009131 [Apolygus lucorum]|uniref:Nucleolar 27S pre-rRNA processing Urb2/Npa2 C-terminal domain-containing protein n=1 Tax=Apolygus lucorum TaxID=248454 RepID=A0A8S9Y1E9_APOLU|nr:hypothetical protein GE061_009131 [Apolygus lucorum]
MEIDEKPDILTCQFIEKLTGSEELSSRLNVAEKVFSSYSIPMFNKEEVVFRELSKLASALKRNERTQVVICLKNCLLSKKMLNFSGDLSPEVVDCLLEVFALHVSFPEDSTVETRLALLECAISLLSTSYFQRWFTCDVKNMCRLIGHVLSAASASSLNEVVKLMSLLSMIGKNTLFKEETRDAFLDMTFIPLCRAVSLITDDEYCSLRSRTTDTFVNVVLYNPEFLDDFCKSKSEVRTAEGELPSSHKLIAELKSLVKSKSDHKDTVETCFEMLLMSSIKALKTHQNTESAFEVFKTLCSILGCKVDKKISISWKAVKNWNHVNSYGIIGKMVVILDQSEVPLSIDYGTYTLESWFMSLVIGTLSINLTDLSPELLKMVENVFKYNPLIIENCAKPIADMMICKKSEGAKVSYVSLTKTILDGVSQIQRLPKFVSILLIHLKRGIDGKSTQKKFEETVLEDMIPKELSEHFAETIVMIPHSQILATFKEILDHIQQDSLNLLEASSTDITVVLMTEVTYELLRQLLFSVKIADHSVPDNIKSKFNVLLHDLKIILEKTGNVLVDDHNDRLLKSFLDVCHASGAVSLTIEEYEGSPMKPINKQDLIPFNFSYVHPYIPALQWKHFGDSIVDHPNCLAHQSLCKLMVQKVEAVAQVEEGSEGPGTQTARRLLSISDPQWLWEEITNLAPLFQADEVVQLITKLIDSFGNDQTRWLTLLQRDEFLENRRLVLALALQLLNKVADIISDEDNSLGKRVLDEVKIGDLLEYELSLLITEDDSLAEEIGICIKTMKKIINDKLNLEMADNKKFFDISFVRVLHSLPIHHFSVLSQSCLSLAVIGILGQMSPNPDIDNLLLDIVFRMLKHPGIAAGQALICGLNCGTLLKFISQRGASYPTLKPLVRAVCKESLQDKKTAKKLIKAVSKPTVEDVWHTALVIEEVNQLKQKKKVANDQETEDMDSSIQSTVDKDDCLDSLVRSVIPILESESPSLNLLPTYAVILRLHFRLEKDFGATSLRNKIEEYLELCTLDPVVGYALVDALMLFRNKLDNEKLKKTVALDAWKLLIKDNKEPKFLSRLKGIFTSCTDEEFKAVMADLLSETSNALYSDCDKLPALLELWSPLVSSMVSLSRSKIRQETLVSLAKFIVPVVERWKSAPEDKSIEPVLKFFTNLASCKSVEMKPAVLDTFFVCLQAVPLPPDQPLTVLNNLAPAVEALFALYLFRNVLVLDRLHVYLPIYKKYLTGLARISSPDSGSIENAFSCADKLERVAKTLVKRQKDFSRLAQYVIADVIAILELYPLHSEVKSKYTNIINTFLALCDEHAVSYLTVNLPPSSQELFKTLNHNFTKYHKYMGRI